MTSRFGFAALLFTISVLAGAHGLAVLVEPGVMADPPSAATAATPDAPAPDPPAAAPAGPLARIAVAARQGLTAAGLERLEVDAAGGRLVVWRGGSGPHLVLVHGVGQQAGVWAGVAPALLGDYTVHVPDLPGHGDSEPAEGTLPMTRVVAGLEAYLGTLDGGTILVGNSMGAWVSILAALHHPQRVRRVVMVNGGPLRPDTGGLDLLPEDREAARRLMAALRDPASPPTPDVVLDPM
jgi:hypothetical protein